MKKILFLLIGLLINPLHAADPVSSPPPRERLSLNAGWRFQKNDPAETSGTLRYANIKEAVIASAATTSTHLLPGDLGKDVVYTQPAFDDSGWRKLNLPHDWGIEGPFKQENPGNTGKLPWWGVAWYRKHLDVPASDKGRQFFLDIDGAMAYASVWCNGQFVGGWPYGYASFRLDLTPHIKPGGENLIAIRLDNPTESSRWYPGGGIYRNVWLVKTSPVHIAHWGTYITTPQVSEVSATVEIKTTLDNQSAAGANTTIQTEIFERDPEGHTTGAPVATSTAPLLIKAGEIANISSNIAVPHPKLWDTEKPNLYAAVTTVQQDGQTIDRYETAFGIRTTEFTADNGFLLNRKRVPIKGVCQHHDLGALGAAINIRAMERQIEILKEMGCNAIRTSHNPPGPELLELCDRMGILVMDEFADCWKLAKTSKGYNLLFDDWHEKDLRAMIRRDRNHPCVVLWSIGNEVKEQGSADGPAVAARLSAIARDEDPSRLTTVGCNNVRAGTNGFQKSVDLFGYNYKPGQYKKFREANPNQPLIGSETSSCISSRGEYFFPVTDNKAEGRADFQMSSYDLYAPGWASPPDLEFKGQEENPFVAGEFVWTGFDYLGEPTPYNRDMTNLLNYTSPEEKARAEKELKDLGKIQVPSRSSYFGIVDLCGFKKDRFYLYQSHWRPELPMAHLLPHWNWPERKGEITPVHLYTSGDEAELFLNGQSLGRKKKAPFEYRLRWDDVKYEPGQLKAVAYKNGKQWAEDTVKTTGPAAKIRLEADRPNLKADGADLAYVTVTIADAQGLMVPRSKNLVKFEVSGPAEIVATDNGDATSHESFQSHEIKAFNGLCLIILRTKPNETGTITLKANSENLTLAEVSIQSQ